MCVPELLTGGAAVADINGDGWPDIYFPRWDAPDSLYINLGDGSFRDVANETGIAGITGAVRSNGAAVLDIDNDGDEDILVSTLGDRRFYLLLNDGRGGFTEDAVARGLAQQRSSHRLKGEGGLTASFSIAVGDIDGDGFLDVYTTEWFPRLSADPLTFGGLTPELLGTTCRLLRNRGRDAPGHFEDVTLASGVMPAAAGNGLAGKNLTVWSSPEMQAKLVADLQQLGLNDTEIVHHMRRLLREANHFKDSANRRSKELDTLLDKTTSSHQSEHKVSAHFLNAGSYTGVFQFGATFSDLNDDGVPDLLISGDFGTTQLYWGTGNGTFRRGYLHHLMDFFDSSMGASVHDINGDGRLDVYFTSIELGRSVQLQVDRFYPSAGIVSSFEGNHLYIQDTRHVFLDITEHAGVGHAGWAWGSVISDFDLDGHPDIALVNGFDDPETTDDEWASAIPNMMFRNLGPKRRFQFAVISAEVGFDDRRDARALMELDFNRDGTPDLFVVNHGEQPSLYQNTGVAHNAWLRVSPHESACATAGSDAAWTPAVVVDGSAQSRACLPRVSVGARVYVSVTASSREMLREVISSAAYMGQSELVAFFGLGPATRRVHRVRIVWPRLRAQVTLHDVPTRTHLVVFAPQAGQSLNGTANDLLLAASPRDCAARSRICGGAAQQEATCAA